MPGLQLTGKIAIVTGGAQGFGAGIVEKLVEEGTRVLLVDLNEQLGQHTANRLKATFLRADVATRGGWECILAAVKRDFGSLDIVVNNAGWTYVAKSTLEVSETEFQRVFAVNVGSLYHSASVLVPYLQQQGKGGCFITISSSAARRPRPRLTWYNATKGAVSTASKSMALEFAPDRIRFNCICPVAGNTPLFKSFAGGELTQDQVDVFVNSIPLGRMSEPADIAGAVAYLASDSAALVTGIDFCLDGGESLTLCSRGGP